MAGRAFELSEEVKLPVMIRITTRLAHSRADVAVQDSFGDQNSLNIPTADSRQFILLPAIARKSYVGLLNKQSAIEKKADESQFNVLENGGNTAVGVIASGITYNYYKECFEGADSPYPLMKISQYPIPRAKIVDFINRCESVLVLEDGAPFIEELVVNLLSGSSKKVIGRLDGTLPRTGELSVDCVARALNLEKKTVNEIPDVVVNRPPALCKGCPHIDTYNFLNEVMEKFPSGRVFSDIGCYTLGALPPFGAIDSCVDMGASVTMAKGAADAGLSPSVAVIGDSTFMHSGITGLIDVVTENTPVTILILDNDIVAMTGGQMSLGSGKIDNLVLGTGVDPEHVHVLVPLKKNHENNTSILEKELEYSGVSIIIARRNCIQIRGKK